MSYFSTRNGSVVTASQAILTGLAPDGGLYVPAMFPQFSMRDIQAMRGVSYVEGARQILCSFLEDYTPHEVGMACHEAYDTGRFDDPGIAPVKSVDGNTYIQELFHGPTLAFKDMALQLLPHLLTAAARKQGEKREIAVLVATSGDTGKAALEGFLDVPGTSCTVFYPKEGVSDVQRLQMVTTGGSNTRVIAVEGNFDDCQRGVKALFSSEEFQKKMADRGKVLSSANSINLGRLVPQVVYYFSAYVDLIGRGAIPAGEAVNFVVPTGNFGNILAAWYARAMGLPVAKLICASNRNDVLTDFFRSGTYDMRRMFHKTISPSMDILLSSNLERLLYETTDRDGALVRTWMEQLKEGGTYSIGEQRYEWLKSMFDAGCAEDSETLDEIRLMYATRGVVMDPHTAVASRVLRDYRNRTHDDTPAVIVSTASPYKFAPDVVRAICGQAAGVPDPFDSAAELETLSGLPVPEQVRSLKEKPVRHDRSCAATVEAMAEAVLSE